MILVANKMDNAFKSGCSAAKQCKTTKYSATKLGYRNGSSSEVGTVTVTAAVCQAMDQEATAAMPFKYKVGGKRYFVPNFILGKS